MASDRKQFMRSYSRWETHMKEGNLSVEIEVGKVAIISSPFTDDEPSTESGISELASFRTEAKALADRVYESGLTPEVVIDASRDDMTALIKDATISSMYVIGNGSLSALILDVGDHYDWYEAAQATDHLKRGVFIQRQCGGLTRTVNVPLGLFVVSNPLNVYAAVGDEFYPKSLDDPENDKIQPVFEDPIVTYESVKSKFPRNTGTQ